MATGIDFFVFLDCMPDRKRSQAMKMNAIKVSCGFTRCGYGSTLVGLDASVISHDLHNLYRMALYSGVFKRTQR